jgi:hypothetical protein
MTNEFGRRRPPANGPAATKQAASPAGPKPRVDIVEVLSSPLMGQLAGIVGGVLIVVLMIAMYVTTMKGMGRALNDSWEKKATSPVLAEPDPEAAFARGPCSVQSFNSEFRKLQRELGC